MRLVVPLQNLLSQSTVAELDLPLAPVAYPFPSNNDSFLTSLLVGSDINDGSIGSSVLSNSAPSVMDVILQPETKLLSTIEINPETPDWLRTIVWTDFRLAVAFFVISPLVLLCWSAIECRPNRTTRMKSPDPVPLAADAILRILVGYWQASSLLLITVLFNIGASPIGVITGTVAQAMIFVSLNWWKSLNEEAASPSTNNESPIYPLSNAFTTWRTLTSIIAGIGVAIQLPFLPCATLPPSAPFLTNNPYCAAWLEPPSLAASLFNLPSSSPVVENLAMTALGVYAVYLLYYVAVPLRDVGREGRAVRNSFTLVDPLIALGFLDKCVVEREEEG